MGVLFMKYRVKYNDVTIGLYNVISNRCVEYTIDKEAINQLEKRGLKVIPIILKEYTGKGIPFFDNRIKNCQRFSDVNNTNIIGYHTDTVVLEEME